jgi:hypothetical protein
MYPQYNNNIIKHIKIKQILKKLLHLSSNHILWPHNYDVDKIQDQTNYSKIYLVKSRTMRNKLYDKMYFLGTQLSIFF